MLTRTNKALMCFVSGVILAVAGLFGWLGGFSLLCIAIGLLVIIASAGVLLITKEQRLQLPHHCIWIPSGLAVALHIYEHAVAVSGAFACGWFAWALMPQVLALLLSCLGTARVSAVAGASAALLMDVWTFYNVFLAPASSTASLAMIWVPLWSVLIVVPAATWVAWLFLRR
jgi:hypothetical protein